MKMITRSVVVAVMLALVACGSEEKSDHRYHNPSTTPTTPTTPTGGLGGDVRSPTVPTTEGDIQFDLYQVPRYPGPTYPYPSIPNFPN